MTEDMHIDGKSVARRCSCKSPDYKQLTSLDWVVLDFTDGLRTFDDIQAIVPVRREELAAAFSHLRELGIISWAESRSDRSGSASFMGDSTSPMADERSRNRRLSASLYSSEKLKNVSLPMISTNQYGDDVCAQFLPARLFSEFRRFQPSLLDESLEMPTDVQVFAEFIYDNLSSLSSYDLLGLTEGQCDKSSVKQAYILRTRQFHPDRYFRKNIGPFAPRIAAIFKAMTGAFATLQRCV